MISRRSNSLKPAPHLGLEAAINSHLFEEPFWWGRMLATSEVDEDRANQKRKRPTGRMWFVIQFNMSNFSLTFPDSNYFMCTVEWVHLETVEG